MSVVMSNDESNACEIEDHSNEDITSKSTDSISLAMNVEEVDIARVDIDKETDKTQLDGCLNFEEGMLIKNVAVDSQRITTDSILADKPNVSHVFTDRTGNASDTFTETENSSSKRHLEIQQICENEVHMTTHEANVFPLKNALSVTRMLVPTSTSGVPECAKVEKMNKVNSLFSLATDYASSDSDIEELPYIVSDRLGSNSEPVKCTQNNMQYRTNQTSDKSENEEDSECDSDDSSSEDDSDSDDSSSSTSSSSSDSSGSKCKNSNQVGQTQSKSKATKNEFSNLPPIEELKIVISEESCELLGQVSGFVEEMVLVRPIAGKPTLDLDSVLFLEKGQRVLGRVFDVFGQVADPHYCIRFNSKEHIQQSQVIMNMDVYYSSNTDYTSVVFLHELMKIKGIDISGDDDLDPPEFSDDEEERAYVQLQKQKQRQKFEASASQENSEAGEIPRKRPCQERPRNPWSGGWKSNQAKDSEKRSFHQRPQSQMPPPVPHVDNQYTPSNNFNHYQYHYNSYNNPPHEHNQMFPPSNQGYVFGQVPGFRPAFSNFGPHMYQSRPYCPPRIAWRPPPPPPPRPPPPRPPPPN